MAFADHFDEAGVLDSLSWLRISTKGIIAKLASLYIKNEDNIESAHRNYQGPTLGTVRVFVRSFYTPPRGMGQLTYEGVLAEIPRQKKIIEERAKWRPWEFKTPKLSKRRELIARSRYTIWGKERWGSKRTKLGPNPVGITQLGGCRLILDGGTYDHKVRVYARKLSTNEVKVIVLSGDRLKSTTGILTRMAPKAALRGMFDGEPVRFDFDAEAFEVGGELKPWENVIKVYRGAKAAHKTEAHPTTEN